VFILRFEVKSLRISTLPRESRLVFTLFGRGSAVSDGSGSDRRILRRKELAWGSLQLFDFERYIRKGFIY